MRDKLQGNLKIGLILLICSIVLGYALYEGRFIINGPELVILSPKNHLIVANSLLEIHGYVKNLSSLTIDGRQIMIRPDGFFDDKLLLLDGYNTIEAKVKNKFGQEAEKILEIWLKK